MNRHLNHAVSLVIVIPLLVFMFYKSVSSTYPYQPLENYVNTLQALQVELHRDILRYRNNQLRQYDTLNRASDTIENITRDLMLPADGESNPVIAAGINRLKKAVAEQTELVEDFKTHNAVLQNSLLYFSRLYDEIYGQTAGEGNHNVSAVLLGRLSTLILQYSRNPDHPTALKIFPLLDQLNVLPGTELNALINHSLIIIERLPLLDALIIGFGNLGVESQLDTIEQEMLIVKEQISNQHGVYNALLLFCSLYLLGYVAYVLYALGQNKRNLEQSNMRLSKEVQERTRTERTLFNLVSETTDVNRDDTVQGILRALRSSLGVRYAYVSLKNERGNPDTLVMHLVDSGQYRKALEYPAANTPCAEVLDKGRLAYNRDLQNYFADWGSGKLSHAESYMGITLKTQEGKVLGVIAVADDKPIANTNLAESILTLMASRTISEMSRNQALSDSHRYNSGLELIDRWTMELMSSASDEQQFYEKVCTAAREIANATMALIPKLEPDGDFYRFVSASGHNAERLVGSRLPVNDGCLCGWAMQNRQSVRINDAASDIRARRQLINQFNVSTAYVTPVYLNNNVFGAITVFRDRDRFDNIDVQLINQFAQHVQFAIENMELVQDIANEKERAEITLHSIGDAVITTDASGRIEYMNRSAEDITGWTLSRVLHEPVQTVFRILDIDTREPMHKLIDVCLTDGIVIHKSITILIENNGNERDIESSMSPIKRHDGRVEGVVIVFHDESDRRLLQSIMQHKATHDSLTGLINRHEFDSELKNHIHHARAYGSTHSLCHVDIDRFKQVNDSCGHNAGDELLKKVASVLSNAIRSGDIIGRLGGDEFGIILNNCPVSRAQSIADGIVSKVSAARFEWDSRVFGISASIGIVAIDAGTANQAEAVRQADIACYTAKEHGRNRARVYTQQPGDLKRRHRELQWASKISEGFDKSRFKLYAQTICPLLSNEDRRLVEILVRMVEPGGNALAPEAFIPAAERYNLMGALDQHIIREVFGFISETRGSDRVSYSINLSGNSVFDDNMPTFIRHAASEFRIRPELVCFEITESVATTNLAKAKRMIHELQASGFRFALDDFGSSLSSLGYLKNLPVDYLKIDGSFVSDMADNRIDYAMVAAINEIAHIMNIRTIAEFAEDDRIIEALHELGVDYAQGYGVSAPVPLDAAMLRDAADKAVIPGRAS